MTKAEFIATIPPIQSALKTGGDGARVLLEVPESDMGQWAKLIMMRGEVLKVTVEIWTNLDDETEKNTKRSPDSVDYRRAANR